MITEEKPIDSWIKYLSPQGLLEGLSIKNIVFKMTTLSLRDKSFKSMYVGKFKGPGDVDYLGFYENENLYLYLYKSLTIKDWEYLNKLNIFDDGR